MNLRKATDFADQLHRHRLAAGLTQAELAERSGLSPRTVSDLERGIKKAPRPHTIASLAGALRLSRSEKAKLANAVSRRRGPPAAKAATNEAT